MISDNIGSLNTGQPLSQTRAERADRAEQALDDHKVSLSQMSPSQLAANREYGANLLEGISAARFVQPASGQNPTEFQQLAARLINS